MRVRIFFNSYKNHLNPKNDKINYYDYISSLKNADCNDALNRVFNRINMNQIENEIDIMPIISDVRREFYKTLLNRRYDIILKKSYMKLKSIM